MTDPHAGPRFFAKERIADQSEAEVAQRPQRSDGRCLSDGEGPRPCEPGHGPLQKGRGPANPTTAPSTGELKTPT